MTKTILISLPINELQTLIIDSVNSCLRNNDGDNLFFKRYQKTILDTDQLMEKLGVTKPTIQRWRDQGRIPYIQVGQVIRYDLDKVIEALENKKRRQK